MARPALRFFLHTYIQRPRSPNDSWDGVGDLWPATKTGFALAEGACQLDMPVEKSCWRLVVMEGQLALIKSSLPRKAGAQAGSHCCFVGAKAG